MPQFIKRFYKNAALVSEAWLQSNDDDDILRVISINWLLRYIQAFTRNY